MAMNSRYFFWINLILFQLGWFAAVLGGNLVAVLFILPAIAWHFFYSHCKKEDSIALGICVLLGICHDSVLLNFNFLIIPGYLTFPPLWLILLWALLGITLNHSLKWIYERPLISAVSGAIAAPLSYLAGVKLSDAEWAGSLSQIIFIIAAMWVFLLPLHRFLLLRLKNYV
jgi:prepilin signal peptidase PulO-like enzyme (type II secretory pathway)